VADPHHGVRIPHPEGEPVGAADAKRGGGDRHGDECLDRQPRQRKDDLLQGSDAGGRLAQQLALAERAIGEAGADPAAQVRLAWRLALGQPPTEAQIQAAVAFIAAQQQDFAAQPAPDPKSPLPPEEARALAALCQALFSSNAFLYVD
jgi:hypothetical protein